MEDEGGDEGSVGEVDLREGVIEATESVAQESAGGFGEETVSGFHIEYDGGDWVGRYGSPRTVVVKLNTRFQ